jgi:methionine-rich copper-binding protein CopC
MRFTNSIACFAVLAGLFLAGPAFAHPKLDSAIPGDSASVSASPKDIKLNFSEGIIAKFSSVELKGEGGSAVVTGSPVVDPKDPKQLVVPVTAALAPGRYKVSWHVVSEDTHKVDGEYSFQVIAEVGASQIKIDGTRDGNDAGAKRVTKEDGSQECVCKDEMRGDRSRERSRDGDRDTDQRDRYRERSSGYRDGGSSGHREGFRDRADSRYESRSRPDCVVDDDGNRYCRVR